MLHPLISTTFANSDNASFYDAGFPDIARPRLWETNQSGRLISVNSKYERRVEDRPCSELWSRDSMSTPNHTCTYYQVDSLCSESITLLRPPSLQYMTSRCERLTPVKCVIWLFLIWVLLSKRWTRYVFRVLNHRFCGNGPVWPGSVHTSLVERRLTAMTISNLNSTLWITV